MQHHTDKPQPKRNPRLLNLPYGYTTTSFLHNYNHLVREVDRISEAYVIDARYLTGHSLPRINRDLTHPSQIYEV
jgi:hypothetical protein